MNVRFISAGAGSGKTFRLTELLSERLASREVRPGAVVGTTFTKKAAGELVERVRQRLVKDGHHIYANAIGQSLIGTVNSVCGQLLTRYAFEAGLSPHLEVLGERDQPVLFAQALDQAMTPQDIRRMNTLGGRLGLKDWRSDLQEIVGFARANDIPAEQLGHHAERSHEELLKFFPEPLSGDLDTALRDAVTQAIRLIAENGDTTKGTRQYLDLLQDVDNRMRQGALRWSDWVRLANKKPTSRSQDIAERVREAAVVYDRHPWLRRDLRVWTEEMFGVAARALNAYQSLKAERGVMDFVDQEHEVLKLLNQPNVADSVAQELDLLLVDEFQDTSPIQLALFLKLAALAGECIWVGDIKQAIYGFRGTDPELMKAVVDALEHSNGQIEVLPSSWRARPALVELTNDLFAPAFADYLPPEQVRLTPERGEVLENAALRFWEVQGSNAQKRAAALGVGVSRLLESGAQVLDNATKQPRPMRPGDVAILSRTNDNAASYAAALTAVGIPVSLEQPGLLATPEVHLAIVCLRRLIDPSDTLASAEIIALKGCSAPEEWLDNRLEYLAAGNPSRLWGVEGPLHEPALVALEVLREQLRFLSPSEALDEALAAADIYRDAKTWGPTCERSAQRLANLETLRGFAVEYEEHCRTQRIGATVGGFLLWLYDLADKSLDKRGGDGHGDAVQVLTHHRAKGLEWPVVISADLESKIKSRLWGVSVQPAEAGFDIGAPLANRRLRYWPWPFENLSSNITVAQHIEQSPEGLADGDQQIRESIRLLYVSFTRARDTLVLPLQAKARARPWLDTLAADWLIPAEAQLDLPNGKTVPCATEVLEVPAEVSQLKPEPQQTWFPPPVERTLKLPARLSPSSQPAVTSAAVGQIIETGPRLVLRGHPDIEILGDALHNILAAELIAPDHPERGVMAARALARHGLESALDPGEVLNCAERFLRSIRASFEPTRVLAEWPVTAVLDSGQVLNGWIDVLLETDCGWVIIDHKSFPGGRGEWADKAMSYSGQLDAYRTAVEKATGQSVASQWIHFSVGGGLVEVNLGRMLAFAGTSHADVSFRQIGRARKP